MKKTLKYIGFNLLVVVIFFALLEGVVVLFIPKVQTQGLDADLICNERYGSVSGLCPNAKGKAFGKWVHVDEYGFRRTGARIEKGRKSWLIIGDSVTMGVGVDDDSTFVARYAKMVDDSINVLNPSLIGWGTKDYAEVVQHFLVQQQNVWNIEKVQLFYCLNDVYSGTPGKKAGGVNVGGITAFLRSHYHTYVWLKGMLSDRSKVYYEHDAAYYLNNSQEWLNAITDLEYIASACSMKDVKFEIVILPYEYEARTADYGVQKVITQELTQVASVLSLILPGDSDNWYLYADGIHFSNKGHRQLAGYLKAGLPL